MKSFLVSKILEKVHFTYLKSTGLSAGFMQVGPHRAGCGIMATGLGSL